VSEQPQGEPTVSTGSRRWSLVEWYREHRAGLEDATKLLALASALTAGTLWLLERNDRRLERLYKAWEVVARAENQRADGARNAALEDLASHGFSLSGVPLPRGTILTAASLRGADLSGVNLVDDTLVSTDLRDANLASATLDSAKLHRARLDGADLSNASLLSTWLTSISAPKAQFIGVIASGAQFVSADLSDASLFQSDLRGANLVNAIVKGVDFGRADLRNADLSAVRGFRLAKSLRRANLFRTRGLSASDLRWAIDSMGAVVENDQAKWDDVRYGLDSLEESDARPADSARDLHADTIRVNSPREAVFGRWFASARARLSRVR
jgi:uncharacterized protein YjbI with pentapeptide repeats